MKHLIRTAFAIALPATASTGMMLLRPDFVDPNYQVTDPNILDGLPAGATTYPLNSSGETVIPAAGKKTRFFRLTAKEK